MSGADNMAAQESSKEVYYLLVDITARFGSNIITRRLQNMKTRELQVLKSQLIQNLRNIV